MTSPPETFGTEWRCVGEHRRYGHTLPLWVAAQPTQAFRDAYSRTRGLMVGAGYSWTDKGHTEPQMLPCWWNTGIAFDADALQVEVERVVAEAAAEREEKARAERERHERDVASAEISAAPIRAALLALLNERPWALGRSLSEARDLAALEGWTSWGLRSAERYLANAAGNIARAEERLGRTPPATWFARAADPAVRVSALQACRFLSSRDEDWAAVQNGEGWSQATTWTGHTLSERKALDQPEAAHALGLLHGHRRQLSDEVCIACFGEAPARRRRPAPEQPALGF
ncbi:hypothetical protein [Methylorubrum extorquens]|uniref:Uncharacterized protein n=1 Tax=Methylorubrum extorquens TaxID=408 RepID=A0AAX3WMB4_METEX|nr:hypothetical protein [Methylorubrum extorquens]WHQ72051.1 hypothetical protein KEC54_11175 [Methylorubrum extorquens]